MSYRTGEVCDIFGIYFLSALCSCARWWGSPNYLPGTPATSATTVFHHEPSNL
jgi:hypothetical protein